MVIWISLPAKAARLGKSGMTILGSDKAQRRRTVPDAVPRNQIPRGMDRMAVGIVAMETVRKAKCPRCGRGVGTP